MSEALLALGVIGTVLVHTLVTEGERRMGMSEGGEAGVLGTAAVDGPQFGVTANPVMQAEEAEETDKTDRTRRKDKTLSLAALARLAKSDSIGVRDSALHILLNRAMSDDFFGEIMLLAWDINNEDPVAKERAVCVVQQLSQTNRPRLIKWGALKMLAHVISDSENSDRTYRNAVVSLYRLILNNVRRKVSIAKTGVLDRLLLFLTDRAAFSNDLRYWSLLVLHQFCLSDLLHPILVYKGLIPILGAMTRSTFGNSNMQKYCLHALVRLISSLSATEGPPKLQELLDMNIVSIVGACLKNEDAELVSWAVFLIQEFVVRQTARQAFSKVRGIAKILVDMIGHPSSSADSFMPRVALRTLKCIAVQNDAFQADLIKVGALKRLVPYVESADNEAQFWAVSLLHDLVATHSSCHEQFFALKGLDALVKIAHTANSDVCLYVSDIFVFLCGVSKNRPILLNSHILSAIMVFCKGAETDLQYGGALLALNIATFSTESAMLIADYDGIEILSDMCVNSTRQDMQVVAAKALSTMARKDPDVHDLIFRHAVFPIVQGII
ncbi:armadillo-type protein, partial [Chytriomyces sp. MP71]